MAEAEKVSEWPALIDDSGADVVFVEIKRRGASAACRGGRRDSTRIACIARIFSMRSRRRGRPTRPRRSNFSEPHTPKGSNGKAKTRVPVGTR